MAEISVIIPTYNRSELVARAVESALEQTVGGLEILVVDDGSTDDTRATVARFGPQVIYIGIPHSGLPAVARNIGIRRSTGEYIALLDSDDVWLPEKLQQQTQILDDEPGVGLVSSNAYVADTLQRPYLGERPRARGRLFADLLEDNFVIATTAFFRRRILETTGLFCEAPSLRALEDYDLWLRIAIAAEVIYDPTPLALYRDVPSDGIRGEQSRVNHLEGMTRVFKRAAQFAAADGRVDRQIINRAKQRERECRSQLVRLLWARHRYLAAVRTRLLAARGTSRAYRTVRATGSTSARSDRGF